MGLDGWEAWWGLTLNRKEKTWSGGHLKCNQLLSFTAILKCSFIIYIITRLIATACYFYYLTLFRSFVIILFFIEFFHFKYHIFNYQIKKLICWLHKLYHFFLQIHIHKHFVMLKGKNIVFRFTVEKRKCSNVNYYKIGGFSLLISITCIFSDSSSSYSSSSDSSSGNGLLILNEFHWNPQFACDIIF